MFRAKVGATLFLVFAISSIALYLHVGGTIDESVKQDIDSRLRSARSAIQSSRRLTDHWVLARAQQVAATPQIGQVLAIPATAFADEEGKLPDRETYAYNIHRKMNEEVSVWQAKYKALADGSVERSGQLHDWRVESPDFFAVLNAEGVGVAKADDAAWYGPGEANLVKTRPVIKSVVSGGGTFVDMWLVKGAPMTVAAAPVRHAGKVVGAVVVGYRLTSSEAKRDKGNVGTEVAYFLGTTLSQSSSLPTSSERALQKVLETDKHYAQPSQGTVELMVEGRTYLGAVGLVPGYASARGAGYVVFLDAGAAREQARGVLMAIPLVAVLGFLLAFAGVLAAFQVFVKPFEEMDRGVLEIINGDLDYWFDAGKKELAGTMSQNLNIMVCNLSGRPLPEDDEVG